MITRPNDYHKKTINYKYLAIYSGNAIEGLIHALKVVHADRGSTSWIVVIEIKLLLLAQGSLLPLHIHVGF